MHAPPPSIFIIDVPIGVSLEFVELFLKDHPDISEKNLTTSQISKLIIKPETLGTNEPYINKFIGKRDAKGKLYVAPSTIFVSHAWAYPFVSVNLDGMRQYAKETSDVYFWFDVFTNDQNGVVGKDFDWFCNRFRGSIQAIGKVLLILFPWNDPVPMTRVWCLFEISSTLNMPEVEFIVKLPTSQVSALEEGVRADHQAIITALSSIQAENATASFINERDLIFDVIRQSEGGFSAVNIQIKTFLREWYMAELKKLADNASKDSCLNYQIGVVMIALGDTDQALIYYEKALVVDLKASDHENAAHTYNVIGRAYDSKGEYDTALEYYKKSLDIYIATIGPNHPDTASTYTTMGQAYYSKGEYDTALEYYKKDLDISLATIGPNHPHTATTHFSLGALYESMGDKKQALASLQKALGIYKATLGSTHPFTISCEKEIADL